jgi:hypothetical protein
VLKFAQLPQRNTVFISMNQDEHDQLWDLLGKARTPKERPFFSAKVLQAVREDGRREPQELGFAGLWLAVQRHWRALFASGAAVAIALVFVLAPGARQEKPVDMAQTPADPLAPLITAADDSDELGASLDNLIATHDNSIWLQADPSSLY